MQKHSIQGSDQEVATPPAQPQPSERERPKDLPDSDGFWQRLGEKWLLKFTSAGKCAYVEWAKIDETHETMARAGCRTEMLPRGGWIKAHPTDELERLRAEVATSKRELHKALDALESHGYRRCDIPACNCGGWHGGENSAPARLREIREALSDAGVKWNGTIHQTLDDVLRRLEAAEARVAEYEAAIARGDLIIMAQSNSASGPQHKIPCVVVHEPPTPGAIT